jgi:hypothetical protein
MKRNKYPPEVLVQTFSKTGKIGCEVAPTSL